MKFKKITKYEDLPQKSGDYLVYFNSYIIDTSKVIHAYYCKEHLQWRLKYSLDFEDDYLDALLPCYYTEDELNTLDESNTLYISHWGPMPEFEEEDNDN